MGHLCILVYTVLAMATAKQVGLFTDLFAYAYHHIALCILSDVFKA